MYCYLVFSKSVRLLAKMVRPVLIVIFCLFGRIYTRMDIKQLGPRSLIYDYDIHHQNAPLYCEFVPFEDGMEEVEKCYEENKGMILYREGKEYHPYAGYTGGKNGIILACAVPENVDMVNCTNQNYNIYSVCNYICRNGFQVKNSTVQCQLQGTLDNISAEWTNGPFCEQSTPSPVSVGKSVYLTRVIVPIFAVVALGLIIACIFGIKHWKNKHTKRSMPLQNGITDDLKGESNQVVIDEGAEARTGLLDAGQSNASPREENILPGIDGARGFPELPVSDSHYTPSSNSGDYEAIPNVMKRFDVPLGGSLMDLQAESDMKDIKGTPCSTKISVLLDQSQEYIDIFCQLTEKIPSQDEKNTMVGLARKLYNKLGFANQRAAVDVHHYLPGPYNGCEKPSEGFLNQMSSFGIDIKELFYYFDSAEILDHLLKAHPNCSHCSEVSKRKRTQESVL